jgi:hypothetical protein
MSEAFEHRPLAGFSSEDHAPIITALIVGGFASGAVKIRATCGRT